MFSLNGIDIRRGDVGLVSNPTFFGRMINWAQQFEGGDPSSYSHAILFASAQYAWIDQESDGAILESSHKIGLADISKYKGRKICIIRHKEMTEDAYCSGLHGIVGNIGQVYPFYRLLTLAVDAIVAKVARRVLGILNTPRITSDGWDWPVCSELVAQFMAAAGLKGGWEEHNPSWSGVLPDDFDDMRCSRPDLWETVYIGIV